MAQRQSAVETIAHKVSDVGRYRLIAELARGGMGVVYLALVRGPGGFNKLFVLKELKAHLAEDRSLVSLFLEEARISAKLNHANVVQTIEVGSDGNRHYIAMEFLDGQALNRVVSRSARGSTTIPLKFNLLVLSGMLQGLEYVHDLADYDGRPLGLVHRDVSPHNVFVTYDGQVKLLDFGIAKVLDSSHHTNTGTLKGKIAYMSPEQAGGSPVDRRTDIFATGVMLHEAISGTRMWGQANDLQILRSLTTATIPNIRAASPDVDERLARIVDRATAFDRENRYQTAAEFQAELDHYIQTMDTERFDPRTLGKFVGDLFADDRASIKNVVDGQLRLLRSAGSSDYTAIELPRLSPHSGMNGTPSATAALDPMTAGSNAPADRSIPVHTASAFGGGTFSGRNKLIAALVAAAVLSSVATVALRAPKSSVGAAPPAATPVAASPTPAPAPPPPGPTATPTAPAAPIQVNVTAFPANATISIDDGPLRAGPFAASFVRDGAAHKVVIEAAGYEPKTLRFAADADRTFDIGLEPRRGSSLPRASTHGTHAAPSTPVAPPPPVAAAVAPPAPAPAASATESNRQQIDTKDPYAR